MCISIHIYGYTYIKHIYIHLSIYLYLSIFIHLESVESALAGLTDDPLDDAEMLQAQLEVPRSNQTRSRETRSLVIEAVPRRARI